MPAIDYVALASACPAPQVPSDLLIPSAGTPSGIPTWGTADGAATTKFNQVGGHLQAIGRHGGAGAYAVVQGLDAVVVSGLSIQATAGAAMFDREVPLAADTAFPTALANGANNYCWLLDSGQLKSVAGSTGAPGPGNACYLFNAVTSAGAVTHFDYSRRITRPFGGPLLSRTGDPSKPSDTPPASLILLSQSLDGLYLWDGGAWRLLLTPGGGFPGMLDAFDVASPAQITADQDNYSLAAAAGTFRLSTDASRNLTGLTGGAAGRRVTVINVGTFDLVLQHQSSGSTAANRILVAAASDLTLTPNQSAQLLYDAVSQRWRTL